MKKQLITAAMTELLIKAMTFNEKFPSRNTDLKIVPLIPRHGGTNFTIKSIYSLMTHTAAAYK